MSEMVAIGLSIVMVLNPIAASAEGLGGIAAGSEGTVLLGNDYVPGGDVSPGGSTTSDSDVTPGDPTVSDSDVTPGDPTVSDSDVSSGDLNAHPRPLNKVFPDKYLATAVAANLGISDMSEMVTQDRLDGVWSLTIDTVTDWTGVEKLRNMWSVTLRPTSEYDISHLEGLANAPDEELSLSIYEPYNFTGRMVSGDISVLSKLTNLTSLSLGYSTALTGDIDSLTSLTKLKSLTINSQNSDVEGINGSINNFYNLVDLEYLYIDNNNINGDLSDLNKLTKLNSLYIYYSSIDGSIEGLSNLVELRYLSINSTNITGALQSLSGLTQLQYLSLYAQKVTGSLSDLSKLSSLTSLSIGIGELGNGFQGLSDLPNLQSVLISDNSLNDSISNFGEMKTLTYLELSGQMSVNIDNLSGLSSLYNLSINANLSGDISNLGSLENLNYLHLGGYYSMESSIQGDISSLSTLRSLTSLSLSNIKIAGNISELSALQNLTYLSLNGIGVDGDIDGISELNLDNVDLSNTLVSGDINALSKMTSLNSLYLSYTDVSGDIKALASLEDLYSLSINNTEVTGDLSDLGTHAKLNNLSISGTTIRTKPSDANLFPNLYSSYNDMFTSPVIDFENSVLSCELEIGYYYQIDIRTNKSSQGFASLTIDGETISQTNLSSETNYYYSYGYFYGEDSNSYEIQGDLFLYSNFLKTLSAGTHEFTLDYYWGGEVSGTFTIEETVLHTVTFQDEDGNVLSTQQVEDGQSASAPPVPIRTGYAFTGWDQDFTNVTKDLTITAIYNRYIYNVTFQDYDGTVLDTQNVLYGDDATAPSDPVREGYTFKGWDVDFTNVTQSLMVTAEYEAIIPSTQYTVTFKDWDGTILGTPQLLDEGESAVAPSDPTRTGYTFTGWDKEFTAISADTVVTAQYEQNQYTVTFKDYDDTTIASITVGYGETAVAPKSPSRTGYTFKGWDSDLSNITGDLTVSAQYELAQYTVTFKDWNGKVLGTSKVNYNEAATAPASPSRTGYTFNGWDKEFNQVTEDLTVTAVYQVNSYTVTFKDYDGKELDSQEIEYGKPAIAPEEPKRPGYHFIGWDKGFAYITEDVTVTATYQMDKDISYVIDEPGVYAAGDFSGYGNIIISAEGVTLENGSFSGDIHIEAGNAQLKNLSIGGSVSLSAGQSKVSDSVINGSLIASAESILLENLNISGNVSIGASDISMQGGWIGGNLTIEKTVADGHVTITGIVARDTIMYVRGGGSNSIIITDSQLGAIVVDKPVSAGKEMVRVAVQGTTEVANAIVNSAAIIEDTTSAEDTGIQNVTLAKEIPANTTVELRGAIKEVTVQKAELKVVNNAAIEKLQVEAPSLTLVNNASVAELKLDKEAVNTKVEGVNVDTLVVAEGGEQPTYIATPSPSNDNNQSASEKEDNTTSKESKTESTEITSPKTSGLDISGYVWLLFISIAIGCVICRKRGIIGKKK
jgi:uncharacterized repeat protein (TIGR02543 family)